MVILIQRDTRKNKGEHRKRKQGQVTWLVPQGIAEHCRDLVGKTKAQLELNLAKDVRGRSSSFKYILQ